MSLQHLEMGPQTVVVGNVVIPVPDFLYMCLDQSPAINEDVRSACERFVEAGQASLATDVRSSGWIQRNITVSGPAPSHRLYGLIAEFLSQMKAQGLADFAFFMHKPPGLRLRLRTLAVDNSPLTPSLDAALRRWQTAGVITGWHPAVYEPETYLFGGAQSMEYVHELFTIDACAWLGLHSCSTDDAAAPAWAASLLMLRALLTTLSIADWEDIDVWERVRRTGRSLPPEICTASDSADLFGDIRSAWNHPHIIYADLSERQRSVVDRYEQDIRPVALRWQRSCFESHDARLGSRAAAALFIIFHWNRAALPMARQALIVEALLSRETI